MPSAAEVMKKLRKVISKLVNKLHFLPDTNLKELFGKVDSLNVTKVKADLSHEFAGIAVISVSVPEDFDTTLQELAVSIKQQGDELCGKIPGELRSMLKHMLRRDPKPDELVGVALSLAGSETSCQRYSSKFGTNFINSFYG